MRNCNSQTGCWMKENVIARIGTSLLPLLLCGLHPQSSSNCLIGPFLADSYIDTLHFQFKNTHYTFFWSIQKHTLHKIFTSFHILWGYCVYPVMSVLQNPAYNSGSYLISNRNKMMTWTFLKDMPWWHESMMIWWQAPIASSLKLWPTDPVTNMGKV